MKVHILIFLFILFRIQLFGQEKEFIFERISPEAGFAFGAVNTVIEDEDGFIWFGCNNGLYYYNSVEISKYNFDPQRTDSPQSNKINKLYKDLNNRLWACTENGICYFNKLKNSFTRIELKESNSFQNYTYVSFILQNSEKEFYVVINNSLFMFNLDDGILKIIKINSIDQKSNITYLDRGVDGRIYLGTSNGEIFIKGSNDSDFKLFYKSKISAVKTICIVNSQIWVGYDNEGVDLVNLAGKKESEFRQEFTGVKNLPNNRVRKIIKRKNGDIWIGTYNGLSIITATGNHTIKQNSFNNLPHSSIYDLISDKNEGVWISTWSGGLAYYSEYNFRFEHVRKLTNSLQTPRSVISSFAESYTGRIWIGSESLGLNEYDIISRSFLYNTVISENSYVLSIKSLAVDKKKRLWIGTFDDGLWYIDKNNKVPIRAIKNSKQKMNIISSITPVDSGVWLGTRSGLIFYNPEKAEIKSYNYNELKMGAISSDKIWSTYIDTKGNLWVCTEFGLSVKYKNSEFFERYFYNENSSSLSRNIIYSICEDSRGKIWLGTNGGGIDICDPTKMNFEKLVLNDALNNADVYSIIKDHENNMWFSTNIGIHVFIHKTQTLKSFDEQDGLQGMQYNPNSAFINSTGIIFWGGSNGFNSINPKTVRDNPIIPDVFISDFQINNLPLNRHKVKSQNSSFHLTLLDNIELKHNQNSLIFSFTANNFIKSKKNKFKYRLINYQDQWIETSTGKEVSFTKIPPGNYNLQVIGSNNDGVFNSQIKELRIKINPPIWITWYAYLVYLTLALIILFLLIKEIVFREHARKEIISERFKNEANEMLLNEKTKFFINISHEFRTPLTLIISPINTLLKKYTNDAYTTEQLKTTKRNANRLLRLTNQMLDFRMLELGKIKINPKKYDLIALCKQTIECFEYQFVEKDINFIFSSSFINFSLFVDSEMIEKIIYNLLSNALKFSFEKGQIILSVEQKIVDEVSYKGYYSTGTLFKGNSLEIKIKDNGTGIDSNDLPQIFDRFFTKTANNETGTGIGLHICQEYIKLHNGNILVTSEVGNGSTFIINLPVNEKPDFEEGNVIVQAHFEKIRDIITSNCSEFNPRFKNKIILIVEDNDELRLYIKNFLTGGFKVLTAKNGNQAYEITKEVIPDIVISDILMPGLDGLQLTSKIRNNPLTNHIPIILLTALSSESVQMDSINRGVDLFLTKPFDESILLAQLENILTNRENLIEKYNSAVNQNEKNTRPNSFIMRAEQFIFENIRNEQFDINLLASVLNISRSSLHRKIKKETNLSSTEFIRDVRLKYAIQLMNERNYNFDEIAVLTGFHSTSWFNRSFKQKYGKTPKEFFINQKK